MLEIERDRPRPFAHDLPHCADRRQVAGRGDRVVVLGGERALSGSGDDDRPR
jgi:hypothetical protein